VNPTIGALSWKSGSCYPDRIPPQRPRIPSCGVQGRTQTESPTWVGVTCKARFPARRPVIYSGERSWTNRGAEPPHGKPETRVSVQLSPKIPPTRVNDSCNTMAAQTPRSRKGASATRKCGPALCYIVTPWRGLATRSLQRRCECQSVTTPPRPARSPSGENSRTKVQNVPVDSTAEQGSIPQLVHTFRASESTRSPGNGIQSRWCSAPRIQPRTCWDDDWRKLLRERRPS